MVKSLRAAVTGIGVASPVGTGRQTETNPIADNSGVDYVDFLTAQPISISRRPTDRISSRTNSGQVERPGHSEGVASA